MATVLSGYISGRQSGERRAGPVHDALCIAYLIDPAVVRLEHYHVAVDTTGYQNFGRTIVDVRRRSDTEANTWFAVSADPARFFDLLRSTVAQPTHAP